MNSNEAKPERNARIYWQFCSGRQKKDIAREFGISHTRVAGIVRKFVDERRKVRLSQERAWLESVGLARLKEFENTTWQILTPDWLQKHCLKHEDVWWVMEAIDRINHPRHEGDFANGLEICSHTNSPRSTVARRIRDANSHRRASQNAATR